MIVELAGAPGSGKTTLLPEVAAGVGDAGFHASTIEELAPVLASRTALGKVVATVVPAAGLRRRGLWAVYRALRLWHAVRFAISNRSLVGAVARSQRGRPARAEVRERRVLHWYVRAMGARRLADVYTNDDEAVIFDEGLTHRVVQLFTSAVESADDDAVAGYIARLPVPDLLVFVSAPQALCKRRVVDRGLWERFDHKPERQAVEEVEAFVGHAWKAVDRAVRDAKVLDWPVATIDNSTTGAGESREVVARRLAGRSATTVGERLPRLTIPTRSLAIDWLRSRRHEPSISREEVERVLTGYALRPTAAPTTLSMRWRNALVHVETSLGPMVVKRYRDTSSPDTVIHEHSILEHLQDRGFPAVRVVRGCAGETLTMKDGGLYALFVFQAGRGYSARWMTRGRHLRLLEGVGRSLARYHLAVEGVEPLGAHHLSVAAHPGRAIAEWERGYAALDLDARDAGEERALAWLRRVRARWEEDLAIAAAEISAADLPRTVIHGDFGSHNLIVRTDGVPVVHDFELAHYDFRFTDLVIAAQRVPRALRSALVEGYTSVIDLSSGERQLHAALTTYYLLGGALRSLERYAVLGGRERLATARRRVERAFAGTGTTL